MRGKKEWSLGARRRFLYRCENSHFDDGRHFLAWTRWPICAFLASRTSESAISVVDSCELWTTIGCYQWERSSSELCASSRQLRRPSALGLAYGRPISTSGMTYRSLIDTPAQWSSTHISSCHRIFDIVPSGSNELKPRNVRTLLLNGRCGQRRVECDQVRQKAHATYIGLSIMLVGEHSARYGSRNTLVMLTSCVKDFARNLALCSPTPRRIAFNDWPRHIIESSALCASPVALPDEVM
jgi:hypothetical protein